MNRREMLRLSAILAGGSLAGLTARGDPVPPKRLVLVHGIAQENRDPAEIKREWMIALEKGCREQGLTLPADLQVALPYYGDTLHRFATEMDIPLVSGIQTRGAADEEFLAFQAQIAEAMQQRSGVTDAQVDAEYGNDPQPRGPLNWKWVHAILRAIDQHGGGLSQAGIERFTRDVYLYCTRAGVRDAINRIVMAELSTEPTVVIGHSLGSVVAYNVLRTDPRALQIPKFVTVGSPLGIRAVRDHFRPLRAPAAVKSWYNAYDAHDVVALCPLDRTNFPIVPGVENNGTVHNWTDNRHSIAGYLDNKDVARSIATALGG